MKSFRKIVSVLLIGVLVSIPMVGFAEDSRVNELNDKYYMITNSTSEALNGKGNYKIIIDDENREKVYKELGIDKVMEEKNKKFKGSKLENEIIYIENYQDTTNNKVHKVKGQLPPYHGLPMKIVYSYGDRHYKWKEIYTGRDLTEKRIKDIMSTKVSIILGTLSPWIWIPDAVLGISSKFFEKNCAYGDVFSTKLDAGETTKIILAKDIDNLYDNYDWYGMATLQSCNFKLEARLDYVDEDIQPQSISDITRKTIDSEHYNSTGYIQRYVYNYYKGNPGYTDMLIEVVPEPKVDGSAFRRE